MGTANCSHQFKQPYLITSLALASASFLPINDAFAQVIPDNTLGNEGSRVTPLSQQTNRIDGGALRGNSLFHSFRNFSIPEGSGVFFSNPEGVTTIFSRVTGGAPSEIYGKLGVLGAANLWLQNPSGIFFGPNAQLDIKGAFVATTATSLQFPGGAEFSATNPQAPPILEVNVSAPIGLQFEGGQPAPIVNAGALTVEPKQNIALVGGMVVNTGQMIAPGGDLSLIAVENPETEGLPTIQLSPTGQFQGQFLHLPPEINTLTATNGTSLPEVLRQWSQKAGLSVDTEGQLELSESRTKVPISPGTVISSGSLDASNISPLQRGGRVDIRGNRIGLVDGAQVNVSGDAGGGSALLGGNERGQGNSLNASRTFVSEHSIIRADAITQGSGGKVVVWADDATLFQGAITARGGMSSGDGGWVEVSGKEHLGFDGIVDVGANHGALGTLLLDPRNIRISSTNGVEGGNSSLPDIFANEFSTQDININATALQKQTGNISLEATDNITVDHGLSLTFNPGNLMTPDGSITFRADANNDGIGSFSMDQSQSITSQGRALSISGASITLGRVNTSGVVRNRLAGDGGKITLTATNGDISTKTLDTTSAVSGSGKSGNGGAISIVTKKGDILTERLIAGSSVLGDGDTGNGGDINLASSGNIYTQLLRTNSQVNGNGNTGNGGSIYLDGGIISTKLPPNYASLETYTLVGNGSVGTGNGNAGNAGSIHVNSRGNLSVGLLRASSSTLNGSAANGGAIDIHSNGNLIIGAENGESIMSYSGGPQKSSNGGNVTITSIGHLKTDGSIRTDSQTGQGKLIATAGSGGNIALNASSINTHILSTWSRVFGNGHTGKAGDVTLTSSTGNITSQSVNAFSEVTGSNSSDDSNTGNRAGAGGLIFIDSAKDITTGYLTTSSLVGKDPRFSNGESQLSNGNSGNAGSISMTSRDGNITLGGLAAISLVTGNGTAGYGGNAILKSLTGKISSSPSDGGGLNTFSEVNNGYVGDGGDIFLEAFNDIKTNSIATFIKGSFGDINGHSGNIDLISHLGDISTGSLLAFSLTNRGNITLDAHNNITIETRTNHQDISRNRDFSIIEASGGGSGGNILLVSQAGTLQNQLANFPGTLNSNARGFLISSNGVGNGSGGDIQLQAPYLSFTNTDISTISAGQGNPGRIFIETPGVVQLNESRLFTSSERGATGASDGSSGKIEILAQSLSLNNSSFIDTATFSQKNAGDVDINVRDSISLDNGSAVFSITADQGKAGRVTLTAGGEISLANKSNISTAVNEAATGNGGDISISSDSLTLSQGSQLQALTRGNGIAGNISVNTLNTVVLTDISSAQKVSTSSFQANQVVSSTSISAHIIGDRSLNNFLQISNDLTESDIEFATRIPHVSINRGGNNSAMSDQYIFEITTPGTRSIFDIDNTSTGVDTIIRLFDSEGVELARNNDSDVNLGSGGSLALGRSNISRDSYLRYTFTETGTYSIRVGQFVSNTPRVDAIPIHSIYTLQASLEAPNVTNILSDGVIPSGLFTQAESIGDAGNITINTQRLNVQDGAQALSSTAGTGRSGNIKVNASELVDVNRSGVLSVESTNAGIAGGLEINTQKLTVAGGSTLNVSSPAGQAGNLKVTANMIALNQGTLNAETGKNGVDGANISLQKVDLLRMSNNSRISAKATGDANGGNVSIDARNGFVITSPFENSDIIASADRGNGGKVNITAQGVFGLKERQRETLRSDVVVSSEFGVDGDFTLTTAGDPTNGLNQAPREPRATDISENCQVSNGKEAVQFYDIGHGGLPPRPEDPLSMDLIEWTSTDKPATSEPSPPDSPSEIASVESDRPSSFQASATAPKLLPPCQSH